MKRMLLFIISMICILHAKNVVSGVNDGPEDLEPCASMVEGLVPFRTWVYIRSEGCLDPAPDPSLVSKNKASHEVATLFGWKDYRKIYAEVGDGVWYSTHKFKRAYPMFHACRYYAKYRYKLYHYTSMMPGNKWKLFFCG